MNRQNQKIRNITFSGQDAMLLIPPGMLKEAVVLCRESPEALIFLDEFFPPGLRDYLMKVLEANRHLPLFSRSVLHTGHAPLRYSTPRGAEQGGLLYPHPASAERTAGRPPPMVH